MPKKQIRNNAYYEQMLKDRFPAVYADFQSGRFSSLRSALISVGMKRPRSRLQELMNAWSKASDTERRAFVQWLRSQSANAKAPSGSTQKGASRPITIERRLEPWTITKIKDVMTRRGLKPGDVAQELGLSRHDTSLAMAMWGGTRLQPGVIAALEKWLAAH